MAKNNWLNIGVRGDIIWPRQECHFRFGGQEIVAMPPTATTEASLHIDLSHLNDDSAVGRSLLNELLSLATWFHQESAFLLDGWNGNPSPLAVSKSRIHFGPAIHTQHEFINWYYPWDRAELDLARHALGLYREAVNMRRLQAIPYAFLGFYKILEKTFPEKNGTNRNMWIQQKIAGIIDNDKRSFHLNLIEKHIEINPQSILFELTENGRHAVAHAKLKNSVNPDDALHIRKLSVFLPLVSHLARLSMIEKLNLKENHLS